MKFPTISVPFELGQTVATPMWDYRNNNKEGW